MELVRDVVSAMEDEMMDAFEFSASQPVSAAFNVAVPSTPPERNISDDDSQSESDDTNAEAGPSTCSAEKKTKHSKKRRYPLKEDHFLRQYAIEAEKAQALSKIADSQIDDMQSGSLRPDIQQLLNTESDSQKAHRFDGQGKKAWEEKFPIMETMSQGAINEMVDKTFKSVKTEREGYINFEEFKECVQTDSSIVSWFEALGTVF